jgi:hypothetical protein
MRIILTERRSIPVDPSVGTTTLSSCNKREEIQFLITDSLLRMLRFGVGDNERYFSKEAN